MYLYDQLINKKLIQFCNSVSPNLRAQARRNVDYGSERWLLEPGDDLAHEDWSPSGSREGFSGLSSNLPYRNARLSPVLRDNTKNPENQEDRHHESYLN